MDDQNQMPQGEEEKHDWAPAADEGADQAASDGDAAAEEVPAEEKPEEEQANV